MTPPESPSSLLERAAQRLEELAAVATEGAWRASGYEVYSDAAEAPIVELGFTEGGFGREEDAAWAAMANPLLAAPLVAWLRAVESYVGDGRRLNDADRAALRTARIILGEPVPGEDSK